MLAINLRQLFFQHALQSTQLMTKVTMLVLLSALLIVILVSASIGAVNIPISHSIAIILNQLGINLPIDYLAQHETILIDIRLPRICLGLLVGAGLAVSGALLQGLFRNPLADPTLLGVSNTAAMGAVFIIVLGNYWFPQYMNTMQDYALPLAAFIAGLVSTLLSYKLAQVNGQTQIATLLLAGIAITAISGAGVGMLTYIADDQALRSLTFWTMGSLGGTNWKTVCIIAPLIIGTLIYLPYIAKPLNILLLGEVSASHLGIRVEHMKRIIIIFTALMVGSSVAFTGVIGFVGLIVPHLLRIIIGPNHHSLLPASAILGALFLSLADLLCRTIIAPAELPIGIITALIGGPFFISLLIKYRHKLSL